MPRAPSRPENRRRTQAERTSETRARLMDATIESLVKVGYARTTTIEVGARAGLSRGAQLHHFPNKADLLVAAVEYLTEERMRKLQEELGPLLAESGGDPLTPVFDVLWSAFSGPLFWAALELVVASRTDPELRVKYAALERRVSRRILGAMEELLGGDMAEARAAIRLTLYLMNGMAIERITSPDDAGRRELLEGWKEHVRSLLPAAHGRRKVRRRA